ncbi:TauD/TfdA family dioxygenase, partial [Xenorhabdus sp. IM139775]|uniref:TauD/TfdA family dioxygenase n=1 Tax=Xenorhabdus sp. IM139775 TaxID=3025876 RepID=UPI0023584178
MLNGLYSTRQPATSHDNAPHITVAHPVIIENVQTKKHYIYVSENTIAFFHDKEILFNSDKLKKSILDKMLSSENIYSHQWEERDLLLYDNSQLLHRRESFTGNRFIKGLKIYPDTSYQPEIPGWAV